MSHVKICHQLTSSLSFMRVLIIMWKVFVMHFLEIICYTNIFDVSDLRMHLLPCVKFSYCGHSSVTTRTRPSCMMKNCWNYWRRSTRWATEMKNWIWVCANHSVISLFLARYGNFIIILLHDALYDRSHLHLQLLVLLPHCIYYPNKTEDVFVHLF